MFYCEDCRIKNAWPESDLESFGSCEVCRERKKCYYNSSQELSMEAQDMVDEIKKSQGPHRHNPDEITTKLKQWRAFSKEVENHILNYVKPQYGDFPDKTIAKFTPEKIQGKLEAYVDRIGKSSRGLIDEIRDCLKVAHFMCYLHAILTKGDAQK